MRRSVTYTRGSASRGAVPCRACGCLGTTDKPYPAQPNPTLAGRSTPSPPPPPFKSELCAVLTLISSMHRPGLSLRGPRVLASPVLQGSASWQLKQTNTRLRSGLRSYEGLVPCRGVAWRAVSFPQGPSDLRVRRQGREGRGLTCLVTPAPVCDWRRVPSRPRSLTPRSQPLFIVICGVSARVTEDGSSRVFRSSDKSGCPAQTRHVGPQGG